MRYIKDFSGVLDDTLLKSGRMVVLYEMSKLSKRNK